MVVGVGEDGVFRDDTQLLTWCSESSSNLTSSLLPATTWRLASEGELNVQLQGKKWRRSSQSTATALTTSRPSGELVSLCRYGFSLSRATGALTALTTTVQIAHSHF